MIYGSSAESVGNFGFWKCPKHVILIEVKKRGEWEPFKIAEKPHYEFPNDQLSKFLLEYEFNNSYFRYGIFSDLDNLILYENNFGFVQKILDFSEGNQFKDDPERALKKIKDILIKKPKIPHIITVYNNKGGVGKTLITYALTKTLSESYGMKIASLDLDPLQGDLTRFNNKKHTDFVDILNLVDKAKHKDIVTQLTEGKILGQTFHSKKKGENHFLGKCETISSSLST